MSELTLLEVESEVFIMATMYIKHHALRGNLRPPSSGSSRMLVHIYHDMTSHPKSWSHSLLDQPMKFLLTASVISHV